MSPYPKSYHYNLPRPNPTFDTDADSQVSREEVEFDELAERVDHLESRIDELQSRLDSWWVKP